MYPRYGWETSIGLVYGVGDGKGGGEGRILRTRRQIERLVSPIHPSTHLHLDNLPELSLGYNNKDSLQCVVCPLSFYDCNLNTRSL